MCLFRQANRAREENIIYIKYSAMRFYIEGNWETSGRLALKGQQASVVIARSAKQI